MDSAANIDLIDRDYVGAGGSLHEDGEGVFDDVVCCTVVISNDLCLFHTGYARSWAVRPDVITRNSPTSGPAWTGRC